jgi:hypothetical protein
MAAAPPLPLPAPVTDESPVSTLLSTLSNAVPALPPEVSAAIAQQPGQTGDNAVTTAQSAQGFQSASDLAATLVHESSANQTAVWRTYGASQQAMLRSAGYRPPDTGGGFWHTLTHGVGQGLHDVANAAWSGLRAEQHIERTLFAVADQNPDDPMSGSWSDVLHSLHSGSDWARAWDETSSGQRYILPQVERQVQNTYGDQTYQLAFKLATGTSPQLLIQAAGTQTARDALAQQIGTDPQLHAAVAALNAGHVSTGRMLARGLGLKPNSEVWNLASGITDGMLDWYGDPTVVGTKAVMGARAARFAVANREQVMNLFDRSPSVKKYVGYVAGKIADHQAGDPNAVADLMNGPGGKSITPFIRVLIESDATSPQKVAQVYGDMAEVGWLTRYNPAQLPGMTGAGWMPHLSSLGQARFAVKGFLQAPIDWAADRPATVGPVSPGDLIAHPLNGAATLLQTHAAAGIGQFLKKVTTIAPPTEFDANAPDWLTHVKEIADMALPRAQSNAYLAQIANAANLGARKEIFTNLNKDILARMGVGDTPFGQRFMAELAQPGNPDNPATLNHFGPPGVGVRNFGQGDRPVAFLENQATTKWPVLDYKLAYAESKKLGVTHAVMGLPNQEYVDKVLQNVWKPVTLARIGFGFRVAGEEMFGALLRYGPLALARSFAARAALKSGARIDPDSDLYNPAGPLWDALTGHLPQRLVAGFKEPADLVAANLGRTAYRGMANVAGRLAGPRYEQAIRMGYDQVFGKAFADYISSGHGHGLGYLDGDLSGQYTRVLDNGRLVPAVLRPTGNYAHYDNQAGNLFAMAWHHSLSEIANSGWSRVALETADRPLSERLNAVADAIEAHPDMAARFEVNDITADSRRLSAGEAIPRQVYMDWAKDVIDNVDLNVRAPVVNGAVGTHLEISPGHTLTQHLLDVGRPPSIPVLESTPQNLRPLAVKGPEMVPVLRGGTAFFQRGVVRAFGVISKQIDWLSRQPMFLHNFAMSLDAFKPQQDGMRSMGLPEKEIQQKIVNAAMERAVNLTTPYIHLPELRSQFAQITRNLMPFWFAQEQFYKRWGRNMVYSPWAFRQAQLINGGVQHSGFVHKDPTTGQEYFAYPAAAAVQDVLTKTLSAFGYNSYLPIAAGLRGQVNQASPGLERLGLPSYGPLVVVPLNLVRQLFPELRQPLGTVEGSQAASAGIWQSVFPTTVVHLAQDINPGFAPTQYASATMQAIQYLEATGHGIGTVATTNLGQVNTDGAPPAHIPGLNLAPGDYMTDVHGDQYTYQPDDTWRKTDPAALQTYLQRVKNWTRVFMITRTIYGFNAPASPENLFNPNHVHEDLQALLKTLPLEDAMATFMKEHPDASAYTVFQTATQAGAPLPATKDAMNFLDANSAFMHNHPLAGAYFLPQVDTSGKFSLAAYQTQLAEQLRLRKTPAEFWKEIAYNQAASVYFAAEDRKNAMLNAPGGVNRTTIDQAWLQQSQQFLQANPLFAAQLGVTAATPGSLVGAESSTYSRANLLADLATALKDPDLPATQQTNDVRTLVNAFLTEQAMIHPYGAPGTPNVSSQQRFQMETVFATEAQAWIAGHPDVQGLYNRLVRPTLSSVLSSEAAVI